MATVRGQSDVRRFIADVPGQLQRKVLRGAARAAATVVAEDAKERSISTEVAAAIKIKVTSETSRVVSKVQVRGEGAYLAPWLEYGTSAHLISVDESQRGGRSVGRINRLAKEEGSSHSLVIGGKFVGATVMHPGAKPHAFLRPALDAKERDAIAAAQSFINSKVGRGGIIGTPDPEDGE